MSRGLHNVFTTLPAVYPERGTLQSCLHAPCALQVLTKRVAFLVSELGISGDDILAITFTRKGAAEMKKRLRRELVPADADRVRVGTFHSVAISILRRWVHRLPSTALNTRFTVATENDHQSHIAESLSDLSEFGRRMSNPDTRKRASLEVKEQWEHEARAWVVLNKMEEESRREREQGGKRALPYASLKKAVHSVCATSALAPLLHPRLTPAARLAT